MNCEICDKWMFEQGPHACKGASFKDFASEYDHTTWDMVVETDENCTEQQRHRICTLGYYGKQVRPEHAEMLEAGTRWKGQKPYSVQASGPDGDSEEGFDTLEDARAYIKARLQWTEGPVTFMSDYMRYHLRGFELADVGIDWQERLP